MDPPKTAATQTPSGSASSASAAKPSPAARIIVRQRGTPHKPGLNVGRGSDDTLYAKIAGVVKFQNSGQKGRFVSIIPTAAQKQPRNSEHASPQAPLRRGFCAFGRIRYTTRESIMQDFITSRREEIADLCRKHHVRRLAIFGSAVRDDFDPVRSDVDVLVELRP